MKPIYVIQNQYNRYLSKQEEWIDGSDANLLYITPHKDVAINTKVEQSVRDPLLRLRVVACTLNAKGLPQIEPSTSLQGDFIDSRRGDSFDAARAEPSAAIHSYSERRT